MRQEAGNGNEDYVIGRNVESDDGDDLIWWIIVSGFSIILQALNNLFLIERSLRLIYLKESWILYLCWSSISLYICHPLLPKKARFTFPCSFFRRRAENDVILKRSGYIMFLTLWILRDVYIRHSKYVVVPTGRIYTLQWWFQVPVLK